MNGFAGGVFDGRYVYFVPYATRYLVRYDTTRNAFTSAASWERMDLGAQGYAGAVFDGKYVYFVPGVKSGPHGVLVRVIPEQYAVPASWEVFDTSSVHAAAKGFAGAVFDGKFLYFVPNVNVFLRYESVQSRVAVDPKRPASSY